MLVLDEDDPMVTEMIYALMYHDMADLMSSIDIEGSARSSAGSTLNSTYGGTTPR